MENKKHHNKTMVRIAKGRDNPYVMIDKKALGDPNISWKAKGLLSYLLSLPDDWKIYINELQNHSTDGRDSTASALKELIKNEYVVKHKDRDELGRICGITYTVFEYPPEKPESLKNKELHPETGFPFLDNPFTENPALLNNNNTNIVVVNHPKNGNNKNHKNKFTCTNKPIVNQNNAVSDDEVVEKTIKEICEKIQKITGKTISLPVVTRYAQNYTMEQIDIAINELSNQIKNGLELKNGIGSWMTAALRDGYKPDQKPTVKYAKLTKYSKKNTFLSSDESREKNKRQELIRKLYMS